MDGLLVRLLEHPGVEQLILLGDDGLVVRQMGVGGGDEETIAAAIPALAGSCRAVGAAAKRGGFRTAVVELERGVAIVLSLSSDLLIAVFLRPDVGFAALLQQLRSEREALLELL